jgi:hypothetical protein
MSNTQLKIYSNLSQLTSEEFGRHKEQFRTAVQKSPSPVLIKNDLISAFQVVFYFKLSTYFEREYENQYFSLKSSEIEEEINIDHEISLKIHF